MISQILQNNLAPWMVQVSVIALLGALLPLVFRIRHPRTQLAYCHFVLAASLLLPMFQPWHRAIVDSNTSQSEITISMMGGWTLGNGGATHHVWTWIVVWILAAGFLVRLGWLTAGLFRVRRYRRSSVRLGSIPDSVVLAEERTHACADFYISAEVKSPATVGFFRPLVLLPESFLNLSSASQHGIACHELLHVRRGDWLVTVIEEIAASVFWFHPGVWWLLGQARLSREQLVDAEVVRLTAAREDYIASLLAIAGTGLELDLAPAPLFLRRRHLAQRMHLLLSEVSMSKVRLVMSYTAMSAILGIAAWTMFVLFPLEIRAQFTPDPFLPSQIIQTAKPVAALPAATQFAAASPSSTQGVVGGLRGGGQDGNVLAPPPPPPPPPPPLPSGQSAPLRMGGDVAAQNLISKVTPAYPAEARQARVEGSVILSVQISKEGKVADARIVTATNPLLTPGVLEAVQQWVYSPVLLNGQPVEVVTTVTVNFTLQQ